MQETKTPHISSDITYCDIFNKNCSKTNVNTIALMDVYVENASTT